MTKPNTHGGPGRNQGRKAGPSGPASARLNIKCRPDELSAWSAAAKAEGVTRSEWVKTCLNQFGPGSRITPPNGGGHLP
jgi:hypothetical protein